VVCLWISWEMGDKSWKWCFDKLDYIMALVKLLLWWNGLRNSVLNENFWVWGWFGEKRVFDLKDVFKWLSKLNYFEISWIELFWVINDIK